MRDNVFMELKVQKSTLLVTHLNIKYSKTWGSNILKADFLLDNYRSELEFPINNFLNKIYDFEMNI